MYEMRMNIIQATYNPNNQNENKSDNNKSNK